MGIAERAGGTGAFIDQMADLLGLSLAELDTLAGRPVSIPLPHAAACLLKLMCRI